MPFVLIIQLIMSGFIFQLKGIAKAVSMLTISKWGIRALCVCCKINQYPPEDVHSYEYAVYHQNEVEYSTGGARIIILWLVLILFTIAFSALSAAALRLVDKDKRWPDFRSNGRGRFFVPKRGRDGSSSPSGSIVPTVPIGSILTFYFAKLAKISVFIP